MEEGFTILAGYVALAVEAATVVIVAVGALEALYHLTVHMIADREQFWTRRAIWLRFAAWILLALEFALAADIIRTAIAPSWNDIGKLGAIAGIRTVLNFFMARDLETARTQSERRLPPSPGASEGV